MKSKLMLIALGLHGTMATAQTLPNPIVDGDYFENNLAEAQLGQLLFYDPILSGNREVACATCHHPSLGTADGVSLGFGDGGIGLGPARRADPNNPPEERIPRNAPALFNLGAREFTVLFHDGRLQVDPSRPGGLRTPMDEDMVVGFASLLSAQTMFPVLSRDEMAGSHSENGVARAVRQGLIAGGAGAWDQLAKRVAGLPAYAVQFQDVYDHIGGPEEIAFTDISNAIAVFMAHEWRSDTAPFDAVLRDEAQLEGAAQTGMMLFYGGAGCSTCHAGAYLTDHDFHAMGAPQIGPGKAASFEDHQRDEGRFRVTGKRADLYAFRTPSLRNVALTGPYGHAGSHQDLGRFIMDHADPAAGLKRYEAWQAILPPFETDDFAVMSDPEQAAQIAAAVEVKPVGLSDSDVKAILAFLDSMTDPISITGRLGVPDAVPSGLRIPNPN
ncbi:cytochrome-c peroxidase [Sulfitobacter sp. SK012]|uniref:cytochrome-c peroxidase n=1 Tax=Sulfitobacter sp. SK012 TaxID=1389005 RepID=UPI000E0B1B8C|nr:cytochrome c peroxidase [Sulfitobacter sp. SK012]AXI47977.1 cytochrome-c peroxidase [Sulfitobacter sp. SK012]